MITMTPSEIRGALVSHFRDNYSETPVEYENIKLDDASKKNPFVSFNITFTTSEGVIKGNGANTRYAGLVFIDIRVPILSGTIRAYEIADLVVNAMELTRVFYKGKSLVLESSDLNRPVSDDEYYLLPVTIPFRVT